MLRPIAPLLLTLAAPAHAQLCDGASVSIASDGRVLGHLPYGDAAESELVSVGGCVVRRDVVPDLERLLAASASDPAVGGRIVALSCHRSIARQTQVFCRERLSASGTDRAISVAPPGHSEHATGYAVDFAIRPRSDCPDAEACMAATPAFRWLVENAGRFGFEMSFPVGSPQNVKWEPWHWRWVGASARAPGAARARFLFAKARREFPADPAVDPVRVAPPVVVRTIPLPPVPEIKGKNKRKKRRS